MAAQESFGVLGLAITPFQQSSTKKCQRPWYVSRVIHGWPG